MALAAPALLSASLLLLARPVAALPGLSRDSALLQARASVAQSPPPNPHEGRVRVEHRFLGCFPRSQSDADDAASFEDTSCVNASGRSAEEPCRSGLPFYRLHLQPEQSYLDCFTFCLSKGLDLSGLLRSDRAGRSECRCGATAENKGAWHEGAPPAGLALDEGRVVREDDEKCKVLVWQYSGPLEGDAVPFVLQQRSKGDEAYVDGVATQRDPRKIAEEDAPARPIAPVAQNLTSLLATRGVCEDLPAHKNGVGHPCSALTAYCHNEDATGLTVKGNCPLSCGVCTAAEAWKAMPCYPHACGPGGGPWKRKASDGRVYINYFFDGSIDDKRRAVFESAKSEWESRTCISFYESTDFPRIRVTITDYETCSSGVGYPGKKGTLDLNLGWCNDMDHWGSVVHELGHSLGMNHEQNRPDGSEQAYTAGGWQGPYLYVHWDNIDPAWVPQWEGKSRSYTGSRTAGYAQYDYESIMHYGLDGNADTVNPAFQSVPGQREHLSDGDVHQVWDMYQCR